MATEKLTKLETFIERNRPDFDSHEPRPDLWARLEQQLAQPGSGVGPVLLAAEAPAPAAAPQAVPSAAAGFDFAPTSRTSALTGFPTAPPAAAVSAPRGHWGRYGVAAALAALVLAAVLQEMRRPVPLARVLAETTGTDAAAAIPADAAFFGPSAQVLAATERLGTPDPRLTTAVRGMETYYASQLSAREAELRELDADNPGAGWPRELASLDSSYQQLKEELPHHPQPGVVLTAMNRNLQIRLDILDQQLQHRAAAPAPLAELPTGTLVSLADSRTQP